MTQIADAYLSGSKVRGDDFSADQIAKWYAEEEAGYYDLIAAKEDGDIYIYHRLNQFHIFRHLRGRHFARCLAFGCARGDDVMPLTPQIDSIVALEPAEKWWTDQIAGVPAKYIKPAITGDIPCEDGAFDLAVCLNAMHHVPNAGHVLAEIARVVRPGGLFIFREPIHSMGDWNKPRKGLTKNERGFPIAWLERNFSSLKLRIQRRSFCMFPTTPRLASLVGAHSGYESLPFIVQDAALSSLMSWNLHYHRDSAFKKLAPWTASYILEKQ
jgi:SAM-dependent methyltransferase